MSATITAMLSQGGIPRVRIDDLFYVRNSLLHGTSRAIALAAEPNFVTREERLRRVRMTPPLSRLQVIPIGTPGEPVPPAIGTGVKL